MFIPQSQREQSKIILPRDRCSVQDQRVHPSGYQNSNGLTYTNDCFPMFSFRWKQTFKFGEGILIFSDASMIQKMTLSKSKVDNLIFHLFAATPQNQY